MSTASIAEEILGTQYMRLMRVFLYPMGAWPAEALGARYPLALRWYRRQLPVQTMLVVLGSLYYIYIYFNNLSFFVLSDLFTTAFLAAITIPKTTLVCLKRYQKLFKDFVLEYHLLYFKQQDEYYRYIVKTAHKFSVWFTIYETICSFSAVILFNFSPIYNSIKNGALSRNRPENITLEYSINMAFPGFYCNDYFIFASIWNVISTYNCAVSVCMFDVAVIIMIFQIMGHIKLVLHKVQSLQDPNNEKNNYLKMYTTEENELFNRKLIDIINHHKMIVRFSKQVSQCFGIAIASNLSFHLINGCLVLIMVFSNERIDPDALSRFLPVTVINFGELIQVCVIYEVVGFMSEKLVDAVYLAPWERADRRGRRCLLLLLQRVQTPVQVTAAGVATIGVQTMLQIMKTNISYFMFFQTLK